MIKRPITIPTIPNTNNPPIIPTRTIEEWTFVLLETNKGLKKLSTFEEIIPKIITPIAGTVEPMRNRYTAMGPQMIIVPIIGKIPATTASNVKIIALGTPKMKKPTPIIIPCRRPMTTCPYKTAFVISLVALKSLSSVLFGNGRTLLIYSTNLSLSRKAK